MDVPPGDTKEMRRGVLSRLLLSMRELMSLVRAGILPGDEPGRAQPQFSRLATAPAELAITDAADSDYAYTTSYDRQTYTFRLYNTPLAHALSLSDRSHASVLNVNTRPRELIRNLLPLPGRHKAKDTPKHLRPIIIRHSNQLFCD